MGREEQVFGVTGVTASKKNVTAPKQDPIKDSMSEVGTPRIEDEMTMAKNLP